MVSKTLLKQGLFGVCLMSAVMAHAELRDPTKPARFVYTETKNQPAGRLKLTAIWIAKTSKRATINGITARLGQTILKNVKIIGIHPKFVVVNQNGQKRKLHLLNNPVKKL